MLSAPDTLLPPKVPGFEIRRRGWGGGWKPGPLKQWKWWPNTETLGLHHLPQFHNVVLASLTALPQALHGAMTCLHSSQISQFLSLGRDEECPPTLLLPG